MKNKLITFTFLVIALLSLSVSANESKNINYAHTDVLFYGSMHNEIEVLEPQSKNIRDKNEGPVIFATPSIKLASSFLFRWDDSWVHCCVSTNNLPKNEYRVIMVISDKERFLESDKGGSIYLLPSKNFEFDPLKGLGKYEYTSKEHVKPFAKLYFSSAMEAMKNFGVEVYFVSKKQFSYYLKLSGAEQEDFLEKLEKY